LKKYIPVANYISIVNGVKKLYVHKVQKHAVNFSYTRLFDLSSIPFLSFGYEGVFYDLPLQNYGEITEVPDD